MITENSLRHRRAKLRQELGYYEHILCRRLLTTDWERDAETERLFNCVRMAEARLVSGWYSDGKAGYVLRYGWWRFPWAEFKNWLAWLSTQRELKRWRREMPMLFAPPMGTDEYRAYALLHRKATP